MMSSGTDAVRAVQRRHRGHDRLLVVTDEQAPYTCRGDATWGAADMVPLYTWNLAGYRLGHAPSGDGNRHTFGGLSDTAFRMVPLLEAGVSAGWPW